MKKRFIKNNTYTKELANEYVDVNEEFTVVSELDEISKYDSKEKIYTDEFSHICVYFAQKGCFEPIKVKFSNKNLNVKFGDKVKIAGLQAIFIKPKVYFKAESVEVLK